MKTFWLAAGMLLVCGCATTNCFVSPAFAPQRGERYELSIRKLKVVQVCADQIHVMHESLGGLRVVVIPLENDYVTGQYLRTGTYEYVGPYTYVTIKDLAGNEAPNTVRLFREVRDGE